MAEELYDLTVVMPVYNEQDAIEHLSLHCIGIG